MAKHVFEVWGGTHCSYRGAFEKQTDHFIMFRRRSGSTQRTGRNGVTVVETSDPEASIARFKAVVEQYADEEATAANALADVRRRRAEASRLALDDDAIARASLAEEPKS